MERELLNREIKEIGRANKSNSSSAVVNHSSLLNKIAILRKRFIIKKRRIKSRLIVAGKKLQNSPYAKESEFMPTSIPGVGLDFDNLVNCVHDLEIEALKAGYNFDQTLSAFRKIFYDNGGWNIIIPGAASVKFPSTWNNTSVKAKIAELKKLGDNIQIQGYDTAISHLFAGLDAINNKVAPLSLSFHGIPVTKISSNRAQATYSGDLGSVVYEYQKVRGAKTNFRDAAMVRDLPLLQSIYTTYASDADMGGNADAYALVLDKSKSITQNLFEYYTAPAPANGVHLRYLNFASMILSRGSSKASKTWLFDDIFSSSEAYAVGIKSDKGYVFLIRKDPGPGVFVPTFWELASNVTEWVIEELLDRIMVELKKIKIP